MDQVASAVWKAGTDVKAANVGEFYRLIWWAGVASWKHTADADRARCVSLARHCATVINSSK